MIEMTIESVRINLKTQQRVVILKTKTDERYIFLWIAHAEAYAIAATLHGTHSPRPLTHDLMKNMLEGSGASILRVEITKLVDEIFYAHIVVEVANKQIEFDARPSDSLALAIRTGAPVFVAESVLEQCGVKPSEHKEQNASTSTTEMPEETEQESLDTDPAKIDPLSQENDHLKQLIRQTRDERLKAQQRIAELEDQQPHEEDEETRLMIEMAIENVRINLKTQQRVAILKTKTDERYIFIWIAHAEAYAIAVKLQGTHLPRPLTHDLMKNMLEGLGASILRVEITKLVDEIFYAHIVAEIANKQIEFDARSSDALALAVRTDAPVFVAESVLEQCGVKLSESKEQNTSTSTTEATKETEQESLDTQTEKIDPQSQENGFLKQMLRRQQDQLLKAQQRISELEEQLPHKEDE